MNARIAARASLVLLFGMIAAPAIAQEPAKTAARKDASRMTPGGVYRRGDMARPRPRAVDPGTGVPPESPGKPPADAIVLFDGKNLDAWRSRPRGAPAGGPAPWKVQDGYFEVVPRTGAIYTDRKFGDCQVHVEWCTPAEVKGNGQGRGNSGVYLGGFDEVQVLDSFANDTYPDGQAGALYNRYPPRVNGSRGPGAWQCFDIIAERERRDEGGNVTRPARLTVLHNGVLVHHAVEFPGVRDEFPILLQDHGTPVRFRNIWVRPLKDYDADGTPAPG
jgi:hypothetical protein